MPSFGLTSRLRALLVSAAALVPLIAPPALAQSTTLKVALHSDLKVIDPVWTTALITAHHSFMVYDTLLSVDEKLQIKPQMLEGWTVSPDKLTWTFKLRDGLEWHDGQPVTAEDCVASINRWAARDGLGQRLLKVTETLAATDAKTFVMKLKEPYGLVLESLGKPSSNVLFMMPKRIADTDPSKQISEAIGSGPFVFKQDEWKPGARVVYLKNTKYKPRAEPTSGFAGAKLAKVDRVEWHWIADPQTQVNALISGEIDLIEAPPHDLLPILEKSPDISMKVIAEMGRQYAFRFNVLHKPFDNPKIRQAVMYAFNQKDFLDATIGNDKYYRECKSLYPCGSTFETAKGFEDKLGSNVTKAKALLVEAGYDGTPVVLMQSTDLASLANLAPVAKGLLEKAGFKVDLQAMDWQTLVSRRTKKDLPSAGGWSAFMTSWGAVDVLDPVSTAFLNTSCDKAMFGWPCDAEIEKLRDTFARETDPAKQKAIAEATQVRVTEYPTHIHLGQYTQPTAFRKNITGLISATNLALWNVEKK
jgi:peptide/nickel transport system substrate-binding protein